MDKVAKKMKLTGNPCCWCNRKMFVSYSTLAMSDADVRDDRVYCIHITPNTPP